MPRCSSCEFLSLQISLGKRFHLSPHWRAASFFSLGLIVYSFILFSFLTQLSRKWPLFPVNRCCFPFFISCFWEDFTETTDDFFTLRFPAKYSGHSLAHLSFPSYSRELTNIRRLRETDQTNNSINSRKRVKEQKKERKMFVFSNPTPVYIWLCKCLSCVAFPRSHSNIKIFSSLLRLHRLSNREARKNE